MLKANARLINIRRARLWVGRSEQNLARVHVCYVERVRRKSGSEIERQRERVALKAVTDEKRRIERKLVFGTEPVNQIIRCSETAANHCAVGYRISETETRREIITVGSRQGAIF